MRDNLDSVLSFGKVALFQDEKSSGTNGGTFTSGSFVKRTLNTTKINNITGASIASDVITLPAGSYFIICRAPAHVVNTHLSRFRNTSDSTTAIAGTPEFTLTTDSVVTHSWCIGFVTINASKNFELQHRCSATAVNNGLGVAAGLGEVEVYAQALIWQVS